MPYAEAHFATLPQKLIEQCIRAGSRPGDTIMDIFSGSGTTGEVCIKNQRKAVLVELKLEYCELSLQRFQQGTLSFNEVI